MVNRLMDLVVLVVEMTQKNHKSFKELNKELSHLGYSSDEIEQAFTWVTSQWPRVYHGDDQGVERSVYRVLSPWETMCLDAEAYSYLLRLQKLSIVDEDQFEKIMYRILPFRGEKLQLSDVKAIAGTVVFGLGFEDLENDLLNGLDDGIQIT
ncbi:MAG: DUF494 domain-containing protein [Candidatus Krumholzibacteria bacterium]|nr:DUF494 domain-containing protein [Candidatus Krumholzibacteria bacterium]